MRAGIVTVITICLTISGLGNTTDIYLDYDCSIWGSSPNYITEEDNYFLYWKGESIEDFCEIQFNGDDFDVGYQEYKICVEAINYDVKDCNVELKYYYSTEDIIPDVTYSCYSNPIKFCGNAGDDVSIALGKQNTPLLKEPGSFKLKVTAIKVYDYGKLIGWTIGAVFTFIFVVIIVAIILKVRRRPARYVSNINSAPGMAVVSSTSDQGFSTENYQSTFNYPVLAPPPYSGPAQECTDQPPPAYSTLPKY